MDTETPDQPEAKPKDEAESSEAAPKKRSPGRPHKRRTKQILRRHRKKLDRRRKSTRCFIGIPWPQYRETVERLADAVVANRSSSDAIDALETTVRIGRRQEIQGVVGPHCCRRFTASPWIPFESRREHGKMGVIGQRIDQ
ncbi:MAG: hypothetical protein QGG36_01945 [Pirellulaceae bacterium]|nr:hypothetical protein [Pirellulaceae bacterium]